MLQCVLNQEPRVLDSGLKTWGDLLDGLDRECAADRQTVTAVRFDGVDQPTFRAADLAHLPLAPIHHIEIETVDRTRVLRGALNTAGGSAPMLAASARRIADAFRGSSLSGAHQQLASLVEAIRTLTMLTVASATAAGVDLDTLECRESTASDVIGAVGVVLDSLAQWQAGRDWLAVADALEFDLAPAIADWGSVFEALHARCAS